MNPSNLPVVATMAALRLITAPAAAQYGSGIYLDGFYTPGDGGQGVFVWSSSTSTADNLGTIINPTGNGGNGRWLRQFSGPIHDLWFGAKADGVTDDHAALQAAEDFANSSGILSIYYPPTPNARFIGTGLTTYAGIRHQGAGMNTSIWAGGSPLNTGPSTIISHSSMTFFTLVTPVPGNNVIIAAPSFYDMNICSNYNLGLVNGIILNSPTGGFTDDGTSQEVQEGFYCERVLIALGNRFGSCGIQLNKVFNSHIKDCYFGGGDYLINLNGSDNIGIYNNVLNGGGVNLIKLVSHGTFGNMCWIKDNVCSTVLANAQAFIYSNYRITYIEDNYFEAQNTGVTAGILIDGGGNHVIRNNEMDIPVTSVANWLVVTGQVLYLDIDSNFDLNTAVGGALFNGGAGLQLLNNGGPVTISGGNNPGQDAGIPYFTRTPIQPLNLDDLPISGVGSPLWDISPSSYAGGLSGGTHYNPSVMVANGAYVLPVAAYPGSVITVGARAITGTVDLWVKAYSQASNNLAVTFNGVDYTQVLTTTSTWYKMANNISISGLTTMLLWNQYSFTNYVERIKVVYH